MTVLFVVAESPGQVFRLLGHRAAPLPGPLLLSHAAAPHGFRALSVEADDDPRHWLEAAAAPRLAEFFGPVTLLWSEADAWGWATWPDAARHHEPRVPSRPGLLARLAGTRPPSPEAAFAAMRGLRLPRPTDPIVDYATVAGLDKKNLLIEDGPRRYRYAV